MEDKIYIKWKRFYPVKYNYRVPNNTWYNTDKILALPVLPMGHEASPK